MTPLKGEVAEPTASSIWAIAWPMMLTYASVPLMGFASVAVMGHLDDARYLAGVGLATNFFAFFYFLFAFIRWSSTGLSAQAQGRALVGEGTDTLAVVLLCGLSVGIGIGLAILLLRIPLGHAIFGLLTNDAGLRKQAEPYAAGRMLGAPALLGTYALTGWFIGAGRPRGDGDDHHGQPRQYRAALAVRRRARPTFVQRRPRRKPRGMAGLGDRSDGSVVHGGLPICHAPPAGLQRCGGM